MHAHPQLPPFSDTFVTGPVEELLGHGCSNLTLDVMQRFTAGTWHRYAEICAVPRRRWKRVSASLTERLVVRIDGEPAFNIGAWHAFVSLLPGAVAQPHELALQFGVAPEHIRPAKRAPRKRRDMRDWRRMQQRIGSAYWPQLLDKAARWLGTDWPVMRDTWHNQLGDSAADDTPLQAAQRFSDVLTALIAAWEPAVAIDHIAATSQAIYPDVDVTMIESSDRPALPDSLASLLAASTSGDALETVTDAWITTYGWESMHSVELSADPYREQRDAIKRWVRDVRVNGTRRLSPQPEAQLSREAQVVHHAVMLREAAGAARTEAFAVLRHAAHIAAEALTDASYISTPADMFTMSLDQLLSVAAGETDFSPPAATADAQHELSAPRPTDTIRLQGTPASAGIINAPVIVLDHPAIDAPVAGCIIVCRHTDPAWMPLLVRCAGLITERGSVLSHAAIVARELQLPTIVGVAGALEAARHAKRCELDAQRGTATFSGSPVTEG